MKYSLVFAHIIICPSLLIDPITLIPRIRHVFLVHTPAHTCIFKEINNSWNRFIDMKFPVCPDPMGLPTNRSNVVWLAGMGDSMIIGECDALTRDPLE